MSVRIVAGRWRGRPLRAPAGSATRPTAGRVREAIFSVLGVLDGERVLDLFAGSGALGLEALSRGAGSADLVDRSADAARALRANVETLGAEARIYPRRASGFLADAARNGSQYDLIFLDPPYEGVGALAGSLSEGLEPVLAPGARVVAESDRREPLRLSLPISWERRYGDTFVVIHTTP